MKNKHGIYRRNDIKNIEIDHSKMKWLTILMVALTWSYVSFSQNYLYDFQNPDLTVEKRVDDLVSHLTLEEKVSQIMNIAPGIPRLGILPYDHWSEAVHGLALTGIATVFPQAIALAATWDTSLIHRIADAISTETRAKHYDFQKKKDYGEGKGLTLFSPNINIFRDPRWGRTISTPKHYAVHSGPEAGREMFDAITDSYDFLDTYMPAFDACIREGKAYSMKGRTYRYFEGELLYPFGFGLSYTTFTYSNLKFKKSVKAGEPVLVSVDLQNTGNMDGGEVAQLYIRNKTTPNRVPNLALQGFDYVFLKKGEKKTIQFELRPSQLAVINNEYKRLVVPGEIEVFVGGSQPAEGSQTSGLNYGVLKIRGKNFELK